MKTFWTLYFLSSSHGIDVPNLITLRFRTPGAIIPLVESDRFETGVYSKNIENERTKHGSYHCLRQKKSSNYLAVIEVVFTSCTFTFELTRTGSTCAF